MIQALFNRLGKKSKILPQLFAMFPKYDVFIEPFAGTGIVGLNSGAKYVFLNDLDANISVTWHLLQDPEKLHGLVEYIENVPYSDLIFEHFKKMQPANKTEQVARFLILSNWGYMGSCDTLRFGVHDSKTQLLRKIKSTFKLAVGEGINWACKDFRQFIKSISLSTVSDKDTAFIYCDPPYLGTHQDTYDTPTFKEQDLRDLVQVCIDKGCKFAISEFENEVILYLQKQHGLFLHQISEVQNLKNRRVEILLTNYEINTVTVKQETLFL